ncbi:hypothetical protein, partial [Lonsdalea quercina]|uniref:hypothetical protein n=1 Tax=Lonsdalea quercina TaxID=71657 RepID=UPI003974CEC5
GITDSDFPMSSITGRAKTPITTSIGRGIQLEIKALNKGFRAIGFTFFILGCINAIRLHHSDA